MMTTITDDDVTEVRRAKRSQPAQYKLDILNCGHARGPMSHEIEAAKVLSAASVRTGAVVIGEDLWGQEQGPAGGFRRGLARQAHPDGRWLLRTSDATLSPQDLAAAYKQLLAVERGWRDM